MITLKTFETYTPEFPSRDNELSLKKKNPANYLFQFKGVLSVDGRPFFALDSQTFVSKLMFHKNNRRIFH